MSRGDKRKSLALIDMLYLKVNFWSTNEEHSLLIKRRLLVENSLEGKKRRRKKSVGEMSHIYSLNNSPSHGNMSVIV